MKGEKVIDLYSVNNINDLELLYSVLRENYSKNEIIIQYNWDTCKYSLAVTEKDFKQDPTVPVDIKLEVVYGDTDSIFIKFTFNRDNHEKNRLDTFKLATVCGDNLTNDIFKRPPIELEFEKVFNPFILLSKKRYIGNKYEDTKDPFKLKGVDAKGIALTRRDYCKMVKKCYSEIIDTILNNKSGNSYDSVMQSIQLYKDYIQNILNYNIDIDDLVVSAMLASSYKTKPVHVQLAEKLKERKE